LIQRERREPSPGLGGDPRGLLYVGEGAIRARLSAHAEQALVREHRQGRVFAVARLECSWVRDPAWPSFQRLKLETDLIAAHVLELGTAPCGQFLG